MQTSDSESIDSAIPLFDVVISMPPGAKLETIQKLAETEAGLPLERVARLIKVLRSTPNAKVGAGIPLERAEEEKTRFTRAGLRVEITPLLTKQTLPARNTTSNSRESVEVPISVQVPTGLEKKSVTSESIFFNGKAVLLIGTTLAIVISLLYVSEQKITIGGVALPWGKKETSPGVVSGLSLQPASKSASAAGGTGLVIVTTVDPTGDADVDDLLIQAVGASVGASAAPADPTNSVSKQTKQLLTAEFASVLADLGQGARARVVLKAMAAGINPVTDMQAASAFQAAQLKLKAWSVQHMDSSQARQAAEDLKTKTQAITDARERALLQGQVAVILSRNAQLPPDVARLFLSMGAESLKAVGAGQTNASGGDLAVSMAEVFLNETTALAKAGRWTRARASAAQLEDLLRQAPDAWTQARLYSVDHQAKLQTGQTDKAAKSLESALALADKNSNLQERAVWLRSIAQLSDASTNEQFEAMATALQNQLNVKSGIEKASGLTELSLMYMAAGLPGKSAQLRGMAQATGGLSAVDGLAINTDLNVRGDMAMAKMLHGLGRYAEAEAVLQRVGGYLF